MGVLFGFPNRADIQYNPEQWGGGVRLTPAYSGGSWESTLPLTNLSDYRLHRIAQSVDALATSTTFDTDLGEQGPVGAIALPRHNISAAGTVRFRVYTGAPTTGLVYDSGAFTPWPSGLAMADLVGLNVPAVAIPSNVVTGRYLRTEIVDTGNPDGRVKLSRLFIGDAYRPTVNMEYDADISLDDLSRLVDSDGGGAIVTKKRKRRGASGVLGHIPESEAWLRFFRMVKQAGTTEQIWFMWDEADTTYRHDRSFLARFKQPSALAQPYFARHRGAFSLVEAI